jgi:type II secretory ATPase GspE/PulE/Tfp pilus assembly ATPase PilB-like protein
MNEELQSTTVKQPEGSLAEKATLRFDQTLTVESSHPDYVPQLVDAILASASDEGASDVHLVPCENGLVMSWRLNGVLQPVATFPNALKANIVARLKVLSELLTYRTDVSQEGRIAGDVDGVRNAGEHLPHTVRRKGRDPVVCRFGRLSAFERSAIAVQHN